MKPEGLIRPSFGRFIKAVTDEVETVREFFLSTFGSSRRRMTLEKRRVNLVLSEGEERARVRTWW
jgi:hypothetical protein